MKIARHQLSKELKEFIRDRVNSVYMLEILLLLHRKQQRAFTAQQVASEVGIEEDVAQAQLSALFTTGLITQCEGGKTSYRYHPRDQSASFMIDQLAEAYSKQPVPILSLIMAERPDRIHLFAEAFRLVKGRD